MSLMHGIISGVDATDRANERPVGLDRATRAMEIIDYAHHEVHSGSHFMYFDSVELDSTEIQNYLLTTPNTTKWVHLIFQATGSAITQWQLYEGTDKTGTTPQTVFNSNRNSSTAATMTVHKDVSSEEGEVDGTLIAQYKGGSATQQSRGTSSSRNEEEIILKQNTKYIIRVTSGTNTNLTNLHLSWYEHTDKT